MKIIEIEGVGEKYAKILEKAGIANVADLLALTYKKLKELAEKTKISIKLLDKWQEHADLMRIKGVGPEFSEALNKIGVDSVKEFAQRNAQKILDKLVELDKKTPDVIRKIPTLKDIESWINEAKEKYETKMNKESPGMDIEELEGIGLVYGKKLISAGISKCEDLLKLSKDKIKELAKKADISEKLIDKWQEFADLIRLKGVGPEYSEALNEIGIDSVKEFAQRNAKNTLDRIKKLDEKKPDLLRKLPTLKDIEGWIKESKEIK